MSALPVAGAPLRVLMVDDEALARRWLGAQLARCGVAVELAEASSARAAGEWLAAHRCDVVLLDIHMPGVDGLAFARECRQRSGAPEVVFVTADGGHALEAFDVAAVDYLTKPVSIERLQQALARVGQHRAAAPETDAPSILVESTQRLQRVPLADVRYFQAESKYVRMVAAQGSYLLEESLSTLEERYPEQLLRVHRAYLVQRAALRSLERDAGPDGAECWAVRLAGVAEPLPVSRRQLGAVRALLRLA